MSYAVLNPERNYNWPPAPAPANLTREIWNTVFASVGSRLLSLEAVATGIEQIQNELQQFGLARLDEAIVPLISDVRNDLATLDADVAMAKKSNAASVVEFEAAVKAARAEIDVLLAGGLSADKVRETVSRLFLTANERAEIAKLKAANAAISDAGRDFAKLQSFGEMFDAIKQPATNIIRGVVWVANKDEAMDITNDRDVLTPATLNYVLKERLKGLGAMDYSRTGWVSTSALQSGSGEEARYIDIPITPVSDYTKCTVNFTGGAGNSIPGAMLKTPHVINSAWGYPQSYWCTARLTSNNSIRLSCAVSRLYNGSASDIEITIAGRWTVGAPT